MKRMSYLLPLAVSVAAALGLGGCSNARGFCAAAGECDRETASVFLGGNDTVGSSNDSVDVCVAQEEGYLRALRANEEKACSQAADAWDAYMACVAQAYADDGADGACDALSNPVLIDNHPCDGELNDYGDALRDANNGGDCSATEK
jgi:hypothetical protein